MINTRVISFILCVSIALNSSVSAKSIKIIKLNKHKNKNTVTKKLNKLPKLKSKIIIVPSPSINNNINNSDNKARQDTDINQNDLWWLSHLIYAEAGDISYQAQLFTGSVVINRSKLYNISIEDVIKQRHQYESYSIGSIYKDPSQESINVAKYLLQNGSQLPVNVLYQSESKLGKLYEKVDTEYFCYG